MASARRSLAARGLEVNSCPLQGGWLRHGLSHSALNDGCRSIPSPLISAQATSASYRGSTQMVSGFFVLDGLRLRVAPTSGTHDTNCSYPEGVGADCPFKLAISLRVCDALHRVDAHAMRGIAARQPLLDHLVGAGEQGWRHVEAERHGRLQIDHQLEQ
jgi:hypothetical protein